MKIYKSYLIVFVGFIAVLGLLFAVNTHLFNLQEYGSRITLTIISAIWWGILVWAVIDRITRKKAFQQTAEEASLLNTKNLKIAGAFLFVIVGIVVLWTWYFLSFEY